MRPLKPSALVSALAVLALVAAGCGDGDGGEGEDGDARPAEGGALGYALEAEPAEIDPLLAADRSSQVVTRQVHEPLISALTGPFGDVRAVPGLAQSSSSTGDSTIWRFRLRPRVRFQDGTPFNASAVLANADRWLASEDGGSLLPNLVAVDAPRPDRVRFILNGPDVAFPELLADARLGLVSPQALEGGEAIGGTDVGTGTGAFELRESEGDGTTVLARNAEWWGSRLDLGPALDQIVFPVAAEASERAALLAEGEVEVADALTPAAAETVRSDPLLTVEGGEIGQPIGLERSVRGLDSDAAVPVLSGVWLTTVGVGE